MRNELINQIEIINEQIETINKRVEFRNGVQTGLLKTILENSYKEKNNSSQLKNLITGGEQMKYQGISIIKNTKCNTWYARYRADGKQFYISARTQQQCYDKLKEALKQKNKLEIKAITQNKKQEKKNSPTLIQWFEKWKKLYKPDIRKATEKEYLICLKHINGLCNIPINSITSIKIQEELNKIDGKRARQKTYEFARMVFEKAYANEIIDKNPMLIIDKPKYTRTNGNALSSEDEPKMEQLFIQDNADAFLVCLYQGLRKGEVLALKGEDIDFENETISINNSIDFENNVSETKNYSSKRTKPMFEITKSILLKYKNNKGRLFPIPVQTFNSHFLKYSKQFKKHYTIHSLRHTFITRCQENKIPLHIIQKWVGHTKGSAVTMSVYTHARNDAELENIRIYNEKFYSNSTQ